MKTRRQLIAEELRRRSSMRPTAIADVLSDRDIYLTLDDVIEEVEAVAKSEDVLVAPPACEDCGFDDFDEKANIPHRCPACRSERIAEPAFTIDAER